MKEGRRTALTTMQTAVLSRLADGETRKSIASRYSISDRAVRFHVARACERLDALTVEQAIAVFVRTNPTVRTEPRLALVRDQRRHQSVKGP